MFCSHIALFGYVYTFLVFCLCVMISDFEFFMGFVCVSGCVSLHVYTFLMFFFFSILGCCCCQLIQFVCSFYPCLFLFVCLLVFSRKREKQAWSWKGGKVVKIWEEMRGNYNKNILYENNHFKIKRIKQNQCLVRFLSQFFYVLIH